MSRSFNLNPGKAAFGSMKESNNSGDNTNNILLKSFYCSNTCPRNTTRVKSQSEYLLLQKARSLNSCSLPISNQNLNVNLISKITLDNMCVLKKNSTNVCNIDGIQSDVPIYLTYSIYPTSENYNNDYCVLNNNSINRVYYPPPSK
jgi:hypothetical protein